MAKLYTRGRYGVNFKDLIEEIKKFPLIYDFTMAEHCQKLCMDAAWTEISKRMGYPVILCKERWRKIRTAYSRSLKESAKSNNKKPYYLHNQLKFLLPHMRVRKTQEQEINIDYNSDSSDEGRLQIVEDMPENENNNITNNINNTNEAINNDELPNVPIAESETEKEESRKMFLLSLLSDVNQLTDLEMMLFKKKAVNFIEELIAQRRNV